MKYIKNKLITTALCIAVLSLFTSISVRPIYLFYDDLESIRLQTKKIAIYRTHYSSEIAILSSSSQINDFYELFSKNTFMKQYTKRDPILGPVYVICIFMSSGTKRYFTFSSPYLNEGDEYYLIVSYYVNKQTYDVSDTSGFTDGFKTLYKQNSIPVESDYVFP